MSRSDLETSTFRLSADVVSRRIAGEQILVPVRNGAAQMDYLFTANEVGSAVFALLDGQRSAAAIARLLSEEFEVDELQVRGDVLEFLESLLEARLVEATADGDR
jgi:hypothetical protein